MTDYVRVAQLETLLLREHLATPDVRPPLKDCVHVENVPCDERGVQRLRQIQEHYGTCHVTTGNAVPPDGESLAAVPELESADSLPASMNWVCGVYVRDSAYEDAPNPLRAYLSKDA